MIFDNWTGIVRTLLVGTLAYAGLVFMLRISGKRTLSKMNAFDLIVTVALGSTLATILLSEDVALAEGLTAFGLLIGLQFVVTWLQVRSPLVKRLIKAEPTLLYHHGQFVESAMMQMRVTQEEVYAAVREQGIPSMSGVGSVVLETDGSFSVLQPAGDAQPTALQSVANFQPNR